MMVEIVDCRQSAGSDEVHAVGRKLYAHCCGSDSS